MFEDKVIFKDEIPVSLYNPTVYDKTFIIETWFRRIVFVALMIKYGNQWTAFLPDKDKKGYYKNLDRSEENPILACSESNNMLWFTTISYLTDIISNKAVKDIIFDMTKVTPAKITNDIDKLKDIRNIVAHNRIITIETLQSFNIVYKSMINVIENFKSWFLYQRDYRIYFEDEEFEDKAIYYFNKQMRDNDWSYFQAFIAVKNNFYSITQLPCKFPPGYNNNDVYLDIKVLLEKYSPVHNSVMGFFINKTGDEYSVQWPKHVSIDKDIQLEIIDIFHRNKYEIWTSTKYAQQDEKYVCNPLIWFYENHQPNNIFGDEK